MAGYRLGRTVGGNSRLEPNVEKLVALFPSSLQSPTRYGDNNMMDELGATRDLDANEMLFAAGDDSNAVYLVISGALEVIHSTETGDLVVGTLGPGEIVGEITAVIGGRRTATVRAADAPVTVREFSADDYAAWLQERPAEAQRIAEQAGVIASTRLVSPGYSPT